VKERELLADNLADIAHQLKTPITSMSLMTELLAETRQDSEEDLVYVEKLHKQLERLNYLVTALLTLSKIDVNTLNLEKKEVDLFTLLTNAVEPIQELTQQKRQTVFVQSEPTISFIGDLHWCTEAILNLVKNCSEHTPAQGTINLSFEQNSIYTQILVEDNGSGFNKEDIPYLFERFYKGRNARKDSVGIGLALAKAIIEKHNGSIRAENKKEGGARFIIKLYRD
jgi:signal transduction histidine kinase